MCCLMLYFAVVLTLILRMLKQRLLIMLELVQKDPVNHILHRKMKTFLGRYLMSLQRLLLSRTHFSVILLHFHDHFRRGGNLLEWSPVGLILSFRQESLSCLLAEMKVTPVIRVLSLYLPHLSLLS